MPYIKIEWSSLCTWNNKHCEPLDVYLYIIILVAIFIFFDCQNFWICGIYICFIDHFVRDSNKRLFSKFEGGILIEDGHLFEGGHLLNNFTFRVGAYSRMGAYSGVRLFEALLKRLSFCYWKQGTGYNIPVFKQSAINVRNRAPKDKKILFF